MKRATKRAIKRSIHVAVVETDPLRFIGFRALFEGDAEFTLGNFSPSSIFDAQDFDVVLIGSRTGQVMYEVMAGLKSLNPSVRILATGNLHNEELALRALSAGAKGYIEESSSPEDFKQAIRAVHKGSVWATPQLLSKFIERVTNTQRRLTHEEPLVYTKRERDVLHLLVSGRSNREIGSALGIEERTVKAHVAQLMRKTGVSNRIALSVHALTHSLLGVDQAE